MFSRTPQNIHNLCIVCDVQPQYETGCTFDMKEFVQYLKTFNFVLYLFNDWKVNCPDTEESVKNFLKEKGQASDSFKRACFNWGIGRELYTAPFVWVK